jgi:hypothetical protein
MQTVPRPNLRRAIFRLAVAAALIAFVIPLLPLYGVGEGPGFVFSLGFPLRVVIEFFLGRWNNAIVVTVGILFLRRHHVGVAGGVFAAVALGLTITIAAQIVVTAPHFEHWQTVVLLMLEILQAILLVLAASRAIGASRADERRLNRIANQGPTEG